MAIENWLTLFTSDSRPKYANDVISVLASPFGLKYKFRYESRYISSSILHLFNDENICGTKVIIAFRGSNKEFGEFIVPIRWGVISSVDFIADFYVVNFIIDEYPAFIDGFDESEISVKLNSEKYLSAYTSSSSDLPIHVGFTSLVKPKCAGDKNNWLKISKALSYHKTFKDSYFFKVSSFVDGFGNALSNIDDGKYVITEGRYATVQVDYFSCNYNDLDFNFLVENDSDMLRVATQKKIKLESRYDSIKLLLQAKLVDGETFTELMLSSLCSKTGVVNFSLNVPIKIATSRLNIFYKFIISAFGAFLVSVPGILGQNGNLYLKIVSGLLGAVILAYGVNYMKVKK